MCYRVINQENCVLKLKANKNKIFNIILNIKNAITSLKKA